jgi:hypothetical protein
MHAGCAVQEASVFRPALPTIVGGADLPVAVDRELEATLSPQQLEESVEQASLALWKPLQTVQILPGVCAY